MSTPENRSSESDRTKPEVTATRPRRRWLRRLLMVAGIMVGLFIAAYFYVTSASFFHSWVKPKVAEALGRPVDVGSYIFSPSGWLSLRNVSLGAKAGEKGPALELDSLECHFSPMALRQHILRIKSLHVTGLKVAVTQDENGVVSGPFPMGTPTPASSGSTVHPKSVLVPTLQLPLQLDLRNILIDQVSLRMEKAVRGQSNPAVVALTDFSMKCPQLTLNGKSTVTLGALVESRPASNAKDPSQEGFAARFASTVETDVDAGALRDVAVKTQLTDFTGTVQGEDLASYAAGFDTEVKIEADGRSAQLLPTVFYVRQKDKDLAKAELNATVDLAKMSGEVSLNVQPIDRRVLNLAGASQGIDFRDTKVSGSFKLVVGDQGALRSLDAEFGVQDLNPTGGPLPEGGFPSTNIDAVVRASASKDGKTLTVDALRAHAIQGTAEPLLTVEMAKPVALDSQSLLPAQGALGPEALKVTVHDLKLADWVALLARNAGVKVDRGTVAADLKVGEGPGAPGESVALGGTVTMADLHGAQGDAAFGPLTASVRLGATLGLAAKHLSLAECLATLTSGDKALGSVVAKGEMDLAPLQGDVIIDLKDFDFSRLPHPAMAKAAEMVRSGKLGGTTTLHAEGDRVTAEANLGIPSLVLTNPADPKAEPLTLPVTLVAKKVVDLKAHLVRLEQLEVTGATGEGALSATGELTYSPAVSGRMDIEAQDFRLTPLMPLLGSVSGKVDLSQAALSCKQTVTFALAGKGKTATVAGTLRLAGLAPAATPDGAKRIRTDVEVDNDVVLADAVADVRKCAIQIAHDGGKADLVNVTGKVNTANPEEGSLALSSASVDLQPLLAFGGMHAAADAPALKVEDLKVTVAMLAGGGLSAKDLALTIAKGTVACPALSMEKQAGAADPVLKWQDVKGAGLDVDTLLANLAPTSRGKLTGTAEFDSSGQAQGFSQEAMASALRTTLNSKIENGQLVNLPLTNEIAAVTQISQLKNMTFTRIDADVQTDEKGIGLTEVDLVGPDQKIIVKGIVGYDMKLDMPLSLAIGGDLKSRIQGQSYAAAMKEDAEGYLAFPAALAVTGTASKPSVKLNPDAKMILDVGLGLLNQRMKAKGSGPGGNTGGLGGLLPGGQNPLGSGAKPATAPGVSPTPKPIKTPKTAAPGASPAPKPAKTPKVAALKASPKAAATAAPTPKAAPSASPTPSPATPAATPAMAPGQATPAQAAAAPTATPPQATPVKTKATPAGPPAKPAATPTATPQATPAKAADAPTATSQATPAKTAATPAASPVKPTAAPTAIPTQPAVTPAATATATPAKPPASADAKTPAPAARARRATPAAGAAAPTTGTLPSAPARPRGAGAGAGK